MAESTRGQGEVYSVFWLATQVGELDPSCPLGTFWVGLQEKSSLFGHIINSRWLGIGLDDPNFVSAHTPPPLPQRNLANSTAILSLVKKHILTPSSWRNSKEFLH